MSAISFIRGKEVIFIKNEWIYSDTGKKARNEEMQYCKNCGTSCKHDTPDPCIGYIDNVTSACCGHGDNSMAYIQMESGIILTGKKAIQIINKARQLKKE